ncbi:hypothetical protein [Planctomycetes bacterium Poly30]|uniref:hypothetical protein n=1 Tax=Saltatorellus ferox TaxID=2528018 RepID=UPI0011A62507
MQILKASAANGAVYRAILDGLFGDAYSADSAQGIRTTSGSPIDFLEVFFAGPGQASSAAAIERVEQWMKDGGGLLSHLQDDPANLSLTLYYLRFVEVEKGLEILKEGIDLCLHAIESLPQRLASRFAVLEAVVDLPALQKVARSDIDPLFTSLLETMLGRSFEDVYQTLVCHHKLAHPHGNSDPGSLLDQIAPDFPWEGDAVRRAVEQGHEYALRWVLNEHSGGHSSAPPSSGFEGWERLAEVLLIEASQGIESCASSVCATLEVDSRHDRATLLL